MGGAIMETAIEKSWQVRCSSNKRITEIGREGVGNYEKPAMPTNKKDSS
jgi:hypothetical protein